MCKGGCGLRWRRSLLNEEGMCIKCIVGDKRCRNPKGRPRKVKNDGKESH